MKLSPRDRRRVRRATRTPAPDPSEPGSELNIVPFLDIVVNLMLFMLATTAAALAVAQVETELPATCSGTHCRGQPSLQLSVTLTGDALVVATEHAYLAPGCRSDAPEFGPTIQGHDFEALADCLEQIHQSYPDEQEVVMSAAPGVRYEQLIRAMDAARGDGSRFPRVRLSAGVR
ncbi:MAG: ExbD/TolR family protein [Sandaracinaceae bacterium]